MMEKNEHPRTLEISFARVKARKENHRSQAAGWRRCGTRVCGGHAVGRSSGVLSRPCTRHRRSLQFHLSTGKGAGKGEYHF